MMSICSIKYIIIDAWRMWTGIIYGTIPSMAVASYMTAVLSRGSEPVQDVLMNTMEARQAVTAVLRQKMKMKKMTFRRLADVLRNAEIENIDPRALGNKVRRGTFPAAWMFQVLRALDYKEIDLRSAENYSKSRLRQAKVDTAD